jgi:hypothetical protein
MVIKRHSRGCSLKILMAVAVGICGMLSSGYTEAADSIHTREMERLHSYLPGDVERHWAADQLYDLIHADIVKGYAEQNGAVTVKPNNKITRAEFVRLLVKALDLKKDPEQEPRNFSDVETQHWYYEPVTIASSLGIVKGIGETAFGPNRYITRGEIAAFVTRAFAYTVTFDEAKAKRFKDVGSTYWAYREIAKASSVQLINGYPGGYFKPYEYATRAEAMAMISNALYLEENAVPSDKTLLEVVKSGEEEESRALQTLDISSLKESNERRYTGYQKAVHDVMIAGIKKAKEEGYKIEIVREGTLNAKVIGKWNRIAVVEVSGVTYRMKASKEGAELKNTQVIKGIMMLKKNPATNEWKVYTSDIPLLFTEKMLSELGIH